MVIPESWPACGSTRYKNNGHTRHGKQHHLCKNCERQFSAGAANLRISSQRRTEIANLLRERISLRGICRAVGVSLPWLLHFRVECFASCPAHFHVRLPTSPAPVLIYKLEAEADASTVLCAAIWAIASWGTPRTAADVTPWEVVGCQPLQPVP